MKRELTTAAIAAIGLFISVFGYKTAFDAKFITQVIVYFITTGGPAPRAIWESVGILIMSVGVGILFAAFLFYRHSDKQ